MITCLIQYTIDPYKFEDFKRYAEAWPPIVKRNGGVLVGYYLPKEGANNYAQALLEFESLAAYEEYRQAMAKDADAKANLDRAATAKCILVETRSFLQKI